MKLSVVKIVRSTGYSHLSNSRGGWNRQTWRWCKSCKINKRQGWNKPGEWDFLEKTKGQLISECLLDVLNFPKNQRKKFDKFLP